MWAVGDGGDAVGGGEGDACLIDTLGAMRGHRTVIFVTHRPSLMRFANRVVSLESGRIVEAARSEQSPALPERAQL